MDRTEQRYERFAQLRNAHPTLDFSELMSYIHDEEVNEAEAEEGRRIIAAQEGA